VGIGESHGEGFAPSEMPGSMAAAGHVAQLPRTPSAMRAARRWRTPHDHTSPSALAVVSAARENVAGLARGFFECWEFRAATPILSLASFSPA